MSTSPSWFDQEKFSRLVKKVGPKNISEPPPAPPAPAAGQSPSPAPAPASSQPLPAAPTPPASDSQKLPRPGTTPSVSNGPAVEEPSAPVENLASTARISLVSKPPSLLNENRALPALPRRTTPLPGLKSLFQDSSGGDKLADAPVLQTPPPLQTPPAIQPPPIMPPPLPEAPAPVEPPAAKQEPAAKLEPPAVPESVPPVAKADASLTEEDDDDLSGIWQKMALLNEELAQTIQERDHANSDIHLLREQLRQADDALDKSKGQVTAQELAQVAKQRDDALAELEALKAKAKAPTSDSQKIVLPDGVTKTKELVFLTTERDQARKEYAELRKQFETLKREQTGAGPSVREDSAKFRKETEQQLEGFRVKLEEKNREIAELKARPPIVTPLPGEQPEGSENEEKLKAEIAALKEQVAKAKEDASIAQRGLALSQKALQETRDTLREATEGTSLSRHNFDNLKNECAALQQQNTVLQAQNEQLSRELAAAKQRQSGRVQI
jgi:hypothetical protein